MIVIGRILKIVLIITLLGTLLGAGTVSAAGQETIKKYPVPEHGTLELNLPATWKGQVHKPQETMPPTLIFRPAKGNDFQVMITVRWGQSGDQEFDTDEKVRGIVEKNGRELLPSVAERKIVLREIKGVDHTGYYFSVTDKAPNPGEFRYMTQGSIRVGSLLLNFTILHRVKDSGSLQDALSMLREAKQIAK